MLTGLDSATGRVADTRAGVGARLARLDAETAQLNKAGLQLATDLEGVEGVDMAAAIARLQRLTTVLAATQASFVQVNALSLWERLR